MVDLLENQAPIGHRIVRLAKLHRGWVAAELEQLGLHVGQELLLAHLCQQEGVRQTAIAQALQVELPTVNKMLRRLEDAGFVERGGDPEDARASLTYLTDPGRQVCERINEIWRDADARLRRRLSRSDAATLEALLARVLDPPDRLQP